MLSQRPDFVKTLDKDQRAHVALLPKGAVTTWHMTLPHREIGFFGRRYEQMPA